MLAKIEPGALDARGFFRFRSRERIVENFLSAGRRDREHQEEKRGNP
jgi:hypothetical protein